MPEYLTTREVAQLLRIKDRKVYDLASTGKLPCSKAMGKLLFPKKAIEAWVEQGGLAATTPPRKNPSRPGVFLGSHDPLLDWALRESRCGIPTFFDGSADGLTRFEKGEGIAVGLHIFEPDQRTWNLPAVTELFAHQPVVLVEWGKRARGLLMRPEHKGRITGFADLADPEFTVVERQPEAGAAMLFDDLLRDEGMRTDTLLSGPVARTETDAARMVGEGRADVAFGLQAMAPQYQLHFVPIIWEHFDLLVDRKAWFDEPFQQFLGFWRTGRIDLRAGEMTGYDLSGQGQVRFNGP